VSDPAMREKLGITAEQVAKIRLLTSEFRKAQIRGRADLQVKRLELNELLSAANPDRAAIDKKLEEISATQLAQRKSEVDYRLSMREALTSEQRQKLQQMREELRHRGPEGRGPRHTGGHTPPPKPQGE
jgi:Spy/CpxP family protein refolding chaperone